MASNAFSFRSSHFLLVVLPLNASAQSTLALCTMYAVQKHCACRLVSCDLKVFNQHKSIFTTLLGITCKILVSKQCRVCCAVLCCWLCPKAIRNSFSTSLMVVCVLSPHPACYTYLHSQVLFRMNFTFYVILSVAEEII